MTELTGQASLDVKTGHIDRGRVDELLDRILADNPLHAPFIETSLKDLRPEELEAFSSYLSFCLGRGLTIDYLAKCYETIVKDAFREQLYFQRHGKYRYSKYSEVAGSVYLNEEFMNRYMYGLAITMYLWPNHRTIQRFFLSVLPRQQPGRYLEIGPGHGVFFMNAMRAGAFDHYHGVDISPTSISLTRALVESGCFGNFSGWNLDCQDVFETDFSAAQYDAIVMGEVLEHVEQPEELMRRIRELAAPGAFVFITTAINAPAIDHIYLFDSPDAVSELVESAGFKVAKVETAPYVGLSLSESMEKKLPVNIALVLTGD